MFGVTSNELIVCVTCPVVPKTRIDNSVKALIFNEVKAPLLARICVIVGLLFTDSVASNVQLSANTANKDGNTGKVIFVSTVMLPKLKVVNAGRLSICVEVNAVSVADVKVIEVRAGKFFTVSVVKIPAVDWPVMLMPVMEVITSVAVKETSLVDVVVTLNVTILFSSEYTRMFFTPVVLYVLERVVVTLVLVLSPH